MKKLNKTEIQILAKNIRNKLDAFAAVAQAELDKKTDKDNLPKVVAIIKEAEAARKSIRNILMGMGSATKTAFKVDAKNASYASKEALKMRGSSRYGDHKIDKNQLLADMRTKQDSIIVPATNWSGLDDIEEALFLAQIDCTDLDSLIAAVTEQFTS